MITVNDVLENLKASKEIVEFGNNLITTRRFLEGAERECKNKNYSMMFVLLNAASDRLYQLQAEVACVSGAKRGESYKVLESFAQDEFASHSRRILNIYCNGRQIR